MSLTWKGQWITFMDTMLQASIMPGKSSALKLPTRMGKVKINPKCQPRLPEGVTDMGKYTLSEVQGVLDYFAPKEI